MHVNPNQLLVGGFGPRQMPRDMIDREKVIAILRKRFPSARVDDVAAAANAIVGLRDEWREVESFDADVEKHLAGCQCTERCTDGDWFIRRFAQGHRYKLFEHVD